MTPTGRDSVRRPDATASVGSPSRWWGWVASHGGGRALALALIVACTPAEPPAVRPLPDGVGPEVCAEEPFEQLRIGCLVESAARAGREGDAVHTQQACEAVPDGQWRDECYFRAGEELGRAGAVADAMRHCAHAGRYATFCVTHAGWGAPPSDAPLEAWLAGVPTLSTDLQGEATDILRGRWWFNRYFGTGKADPAIAAAAVGYDAPHARGAWALEAIRLTGDFAAAKVAWAAGTVLTGAAIERRLGRYDAPFHIAGEDALPRIRTFGSSLRFEGQDAAEDLDIALLEALYFREQTGADVFVPYLNDPRPRVRYTALRCYRTLPSRDAREVLTAMAADPDPIVAAHVADALKYETWRGKPNAPGLR